MDQRINRLKQDLSDQGLGNVVVINTGKQLDDSWYPKYLEAASSLAFAELDRLVSFFEISNDITIELELSDSNDVKAFVKKKNSTYSIFISEGISKRAYLAALGFLSNNVFSQVISKNIYQKSDENIAVKLIIDIMLISIHFTLVHEFLHIALGHLDYLYSEHGINTLFENQSNPAFNHLIQQAIEVQSDLVSASLIAKTNRYNDFVFGMGVTVFLDTFNYFRLDIDEYQDKSHPHPLTRLLNLYSAYYTDSGKIENDSEQFNEGTLLALRSFEHYNDGLLFNPSNPSRFTIEQQFNIARNDSDKIGSMYGFQGGT